MPLSPDTLPPGDGPSVFCVPGSAGKSSELIVNSLASAVGCFTIPTRINKNHRSGLLREYYTSHNKNLFQTVIFNNNFYAVNFFKLLKSKCFMTTKIKIVVYVDYIMSTGSMTENDKLGHEVIMAYFILLSQHLPS
jgi:hypothetical protein